MPTVAAANIPHTLTQDQAEDELGIALLLGTWVLLCEMDRGNDRALYAAMAKTGRKVKPYHRRKRTQVVAPATRKTLGRYRTLTPKKRGVNPPRGMSIVDDLGTRTRYVSLHLPNGKHNTAKRGRAFRQWAWDRYERRAANKVGRWLGHGWNVILGGDVNDLRGLQLHPAQVKVAHRGLMWLYAIPAPGNKAIVRGARAIHSDQIDHPMLRAHIEFAPVN